MNRYLLFDGSCGMCTSVARDIEGLCDGWLTVRPLGDPEVGSLVGDLAWRPTLLVVEPDQVKVHVGASLAIRLVVGLGPRKAMRIVSMVSKARPAAEAPGRRALLKGTGLGVLLALSGSQVSVASNSEEVRPLRGEAASQAVDEALTSPQASPVVDRLQDWGYESQPVGAVALDGTSGLLVLAFYGRADRSPDHAGVLVVEGGSSGAVRASFDEVQAKPSTFLRDGKMRPAALTA